MARSPGHRTNSIENVGREQAYLMTRRQLGRYILKQTAGNESILFTWHQIERYDLQNHTIHKAHVLEFSHICVDMSPTRRVLCWCIFEYGPLFLHLHVIHKCRSELLEHAPLYPLLFFCTAWNNSLLHKVCGTVCHSIWNQGMACHCTRLLWYSVVIFVCGYLIRRHSPINVWGERHKTS